MKHSPLKIITITLLLSIGIIGLLISTCGLAFFIIADGLGIIYLFPGMVFLYCVFKILQHIRKQQPTNNLLIFCIASCLLLLISAFYIIYFNIWNDLAFLIGFGIVSSVIALIVVIIFGIMHYIKKKNQSN